MKSKTRFLRWIPQVILVSVLLLAPALWACGGGGGEPIVTPTPETATTPTTTPTPASGELKVPVNLKGASNVGSIGIELVYDSAVLEPLEVKTAELTGNAMMEYSVKTPGRVIVGIIDASGINGDGTLVTVSFKVISNEGTSPLTVEKIEAHDATTLIDIPATASAGNFVAEDRSLTAPIVNLTP